MNRQPPPPPLQQNTALPHPRALQSRGETDISYDAYSPSPSSLSAHRNKYNRIQDWAMYNTINRSRQLAGMARHDPSLSLGIGTASWSDTGTGITEDVTDIGTVPTTVRAARGGVVGNGVREKVDVRREMRENQAKQDRELQRRPSRLGGLGLDLDASELPYRQSSLRRDDPRPRANGSAPGNVAPQSKPHPLPQGPSQRTGPQKPMLIHSKSTKPAPTPLLAKPPTPPIIPGTPIVTSPESDKGKIMSPYAIREAYLESALTLPIDMLSQVQVQREKRLQTPGATLKPAKSASSISSGVTITRLASLLGQPKRDDKDEGVRQMGSSKTVGSKPARAPLVPVVGGPTEPVRQAKSNQSTNRPSTSANPQDIPRSLGSAPALGKSTVVPIAINPQQVKAAPPNSQQPKAAPPKPSALGLDLGLGLELRPAPHRTLSALRRPALTPGNSTENLLAMPPVNPGMGVGTGTLGRRSRDPSMTDLLKTRFEPATYPLPESKSSVVTATGEKSKSVVTDEVKSPIKVVAEAEGKGKSKGNGKGKKGKQADQAVEQAKEIDQNTLIANIADKEPAQVQTQIAPVSTKQPLQLTDRGTTPKKPRHPVVETTPPLTSPEELLSPSSPDYIITPPTHSTPLERHTLPRGITTRVAHDDRVSFEVPNGTRGRLRVSLAWVRDRTSRSQQTPPDAPPPLPPKSPPRRRFSTKRRNEQDLVQGHDHQRRPSPQPQIRSEGATSPPTSAIPDPGQHQQQQQYAPIDPFFSASRPTYQPPAIQYPLGRPFAYPQLQPQVTPWASMPHLVPPNQMQLQAMGSRYAPQHQAQSAESFDPPSIRNSPVLGMMSLPNVGMSGMPIGMGQSFGQGMTMGMGRMQNGVNPYSNQSLGQNHQQHQDQNQVQSWQDHGLDQDQRQYNTFQHTHQNLGQGPVGYDQFGNFNDGRQGENRQSIWKRMFNGNGRNGWRMNRNYQFIPQYDQHEDHGGDQAYGQNQREWVGNDKVGKWISGVTPGKAPPAGNQSNAPTTWRSRRGYQLSQPIWGRRKKQYDGPINDERPDGQVQRGKGLGGGGGGMMDWLRGQGQNRGQGQRRYRRNGNDNGYYSTNRARNGNANGGIYGDDPFRKTNNPDIDDYDRSTKRRQKAERRDLREKERTDRARRQAQAQAQGRKGQRKWKDRLPRSRDRARREADARGGREREKRYGERTGTGTGVFGGFFK